MPRINDDCSFPADQEAEARAYAQDYLARWGGPFNPYDGRAQVIPPNDDRPRWLVLASRNSSAD